MTTEVGHKVATRSKEYGAELRRQQAGQDAAEQGTGFPAAAADAWAEHHEGEQPGA